MRRSAAKARLAPSPPSAAAARTPPPPLHNGAFRSEPLLRRPPSMLPQHHKRLSLDLLLPHGFRSTTSDGGEGGIALVERELSGGSSRARPRSRRSAHSSPDLPGLLERGGANLHPFLLVDGKPAHVTLTGSGIEWGPAQRQAAAAAAAASSAPIGPVAPAGASATQFAPFSEMLSAQCDAKPSPPLLPCLHARLHRLEVFTFRRSPLRPSEWGPRRLVLEAADEETLQDWAAAISRGIEAAAAAAGRPRSLMVVLNPNSGSRQACRVWRRLAAPVFAAAGIKVSVRETRHAGHASEMVAGLGLQQLRAIDGVVCVGGDGVFHEALNGLLQARAAAEAGGNAELAAALCALRLAHIPAGSTDAVACTLHGSRGVFTAAMHVALGDSTPLDVLRVDTAQGTRFASCIAAYGFLADVTSAAERYRWLGPVRYDIVGAGKLAISRAYPARIRYLEGEVARALSKQSRTVCGTECAVCRTASFMHARRMSQKQLGAASAALASSSGSLASSPQASPVARGRQQELSPRRGGLAGSEPSSPVSRAGAAAGAAAGWVEEGSSSCGGSPAPHFLQPAAAAAERHEGEEWRVIEGEFCSIMCIVMPCRSDKTRSGMARFGHLADGRMKIVLVSKCSPLQYLRFLHGMARRGCAPGDLPYVQVLDAVAVSVEPLPSADGNRAGSCWNLDGELVAGPGMSAEIHPGLLRVFARGVEC